MFKFFPILLSLLSTVVFLVNCQDSLQGNQQRIVISQTGNGQIRVRDGSNNQTINLRSSDGNGAGGEQETELDEQLVRGLWEWLEEKKKKKKEKEEQKRPVPIINPTKIEKKEIHIHINNHIKKKDDHHGKGKKGKHHKNHDYHHYESYHDGGFDYHDKHYHNKHSWPLLGHHYYGSEHDYHNQGSGPDDDYHHGYESRKVVSRREPKKVVGQQQQRTTAKPIKKLSLRERRA